MSNHSRKPPVKDNALLRTRSKIFEVDGGPAEAKLKVVLLPTPTWFTMLRRLLVFLLVPAFLVQGAGFACCYAGLFEHDLEFRSPHFHLGGFWGTSPHHQYHQLQSGGFGASASAQMPDNHDDDAVYISSSDMLGWWFTYIPAGLGKLSTSATVDGKVSNPLSTLQSSGEFRLSLIAPIDRHVPTYLRTLALLI